MTTPEIASIEGQVAIVTGATAGIGQACAERFAAEGAKVAIVGRNQEAGERIMGELKEGGAEVLFLPGECADAGLSEPCPAPLSEKHRRCLVAAGRGGWRSAGGTVA